MVGRSIGAAGLVGLALGALACSKTQDTAPERRIFGNPPSIESVQVTSIPGSTAVCDWTPMAKHISVCSLGLDPALLPVPFPTITVTSTYNEVVFNVKATDPESTSSQTDILLVTASYVTASGGQPQEISLVVLDDGSANQFDFQQKADFYEEDCVADPMTCEDCVRKSYPLTSNDVTAGDGMYTRGFAFKSTEGGGVPSGVRATNLLEDCLVSQKKQAPAETTNLGGEPVSFKIEAIDRSGNIAAWPIEPEVSIQPSSLTCGGDECLCCILLSSNVLSPASPTHPNPVTGCIGLPGLELQPPSEYHCGFCVWLQNFACL
jgi:hypothetical protein